MPEEEIIQLKIDDIDLKALQEIIEIENVFTYPRILGGIITGGIIKTAKSGSRILLDGATNKIHIYDTNGKERIVLGEFSIFFYDANEAQIGSLVSATDGIALSVSSSSDFIQLLAGSVKIDQDLLPTITDTSDIGSSAKRIKNLYLVNSPDVSSANLSAIRAYRATTDQTVPDGLTKIQLNAENYDVLGEFDSTTNYRFTATKAGYYQVNGSVLLETIAAGTIVSIRIYKNGALYTKKTIIPGANVDPLVPTVSDIIPLAVNDYLELYVAQDTGGNEVVKEGTTITFMSIHRLS